MREPSSGGAFSATTGHPDRGDQRSISRAPTRAESSMKARGLSHEIAAPVRSSRRCASACMKSESDFDGSTRRNVTQAAQPERFNKLTIEVELGFTGELASTEVQRCLNCDVQTVFTESLCIECDACVDVCPVDCLVITANDEESVLRQRLKAPANNT